MKCACKGAFLERCMQPAVLLILYRDSLHGFLIYKQLVDPKGLNYTGIDPTGLYSMLKKMEAAGTLRSEIDYGDGARARRVYSITEEGRSCLRNWRETLTEYQQSIDTLTSAIGDCLQT